VSLDETLEHSDAPSVYADLPYHLVLADWRRRVSTLYAQVREMAMEGMAHRDRGYKRIISVAAEHQVEKAGAAFAGIVLWWNERR